MDNLLGFMNMLILWRLGKNCRAGRRFCWHDFAICLQMACEETSLLYNLYGRTVRGVLALDDLKLRPKCTQVYGELKMCKIYFHNNSSILGFLRNE